MATQLQYADHVPWTVDWLLCFTIVFTHLLKKLLNLLLQAREIRLSCIPYDEKVNPEVSVNQYVSYPNHFAPGEFWMSVLQVFGDISRRFTDYLHLADDPILQKSVLQKAIIGNTSQVLLYAIHGIQDMVQENGITLHIKSPSLCPRKDEYKD